MYFSTIPAHSLLTHSFSSKGIITEQCLLVTDSTTLTFNGSQHMQITMADEFRTQTEDVALRFRTTRPLGLLLTTNTEQSADRLELALMGGRVRLLARLGDREKVSLRHIRPLATLCVPIEMTERFVET
jgi:hypothetical protein